MTMRGVAPPRGDDGAHLPGRRALCDHEPAAAGLAAAGPGHRHVAAELARLDKHDNEGSSTVAAVLARDLAAYGARRCFGLLGTANFKISHALVEAGVELISARHECNAASMADAYAKATQELTLVSVHSGPGLTNALTGIAEAAKSRTPLLVLAGDVPTGAVKIELLCRAGRDGALGRGHLGAHSHAGHRARGYAARRRHGRCATARRWC